MLLLGGYSKMRFEEEVWSLMKKIPEGKITTYKILAEQLGTHAYQAVGNACRRNPYAPQVPCHRVVKSDGSIGGFNGHTTGPTIIKKIRLLQQESVQVDNGKIVDFENVLFKF